MKTKMFLLGIAFLAGCVTAALYFGPVSSQEHDGSSPSDLLTGGVGRPVALAIPEWMTEDEKNTVSVFERTSPSVVFVVNMAMNYDFFWGIKEEVQRGSGSGFIWDDKGHVVTNSHVVQGGSRFKVILSDQTTYDAKLVGMASAKELAVLKISAPADKLVPLAIGKSDSLRVGQKVLAIGNPFGLDRTLTVGIVSALGRKIKSMSNRTIHDVIQTDAAINPGNSGGPLLNSRGELIGVNTAIYSPSGANAGIGFAVPVNTVSRSVPMLIKYGKLLRPSLGATVFTDNWVRMNLGKTGVLLKEVPSDSSAAKAGLKGVKVDQYGRILLGDRIVKVADRKVATLDDLLTVLERFKAGDSITITYIRDGKTSTTEAVLEEVLD